MDGGNLTPGEVFVWRGFSGLGLYLHAYDARNVTKILRGQHLLHVSWRVEISNLYKVDRQGACDREA